MAGVAYALHPTDEMAESLADLGARLTRRSTQASDASGASGSRTGMSILTVLGMSELRR